jgi:hypothetical protein
LGKQKRKRKNTSLSSHKEARLGGRGTPREHDDMNTLLSPSMMLRSASVALCRGYG